MIFRHRSPSDRDLASTDPATALRGNQIICAALLAGQVMFAVVVFAVHRMGAFVTDAAEADTSGIFPMVGVIAGAVSLPTAYVMRKVLWSRGEGQSDADVLRSYLSGNLVFFAILEGASLLNICLWLIQGTSVPFVAVVGVLIAAAVMNFPRAKR